MEQDLLHLIDAGRRDAVADLLESEPATASIRAPDGVSPVLYALYRGQRDIADLLLTAGAPVDVFVASALGLDGRLERILADRRDLATAYSPDGWTPLHLAAFFGSERAAGRLLEAGADPSAVAHNAQANHPLHSACAGRRPPVAILLLDHGAEPDYQVAGVTPLMIAAANGLAVVVTRLLQAGADLSRRSPQGKTAMDYAVSGGWLDVQQILRRGRS
ncbi:MAG TPA: ankyrin repeat domain-containing protein [Spirochaetia bacterium]|nr:ankyrin repeat domain-containing protein [Spirochaetia bacterium]